MSIFYSPDSPKHFDAHTGRMTRLTKTPRSFAREKDMTIPKQKTWSGTTRQAITECAELRSVRETYERFVEQFLQFSQQNGTEITGSYLCHNFLEFKAAFEPFILQANHHFNSSRRTQTVRKSTAMLRYSSRLLSSWEILISGLNKLSQSKVLPHLHQLQVYFTQLSDQISHISQLFVKRTYYKDVVYESSNYLKHKATSVYRQVYDIFLNESEHSFNKRQLGQLQNQVILMSRDIHENFLGMLPSTATGTPEMKRLQTQMKAVCGGIVALIEAAYYFRDRLAKLMHEAGELHMAICSVHDTLGLLYTLDVEPLSVRDEEERTSRPQSPEQRAQSFVREVEEMLELDLDDVSDPVEQIDRVENALKQRLTSQSALSSYRVSRVMYTPPATKKRSVMRKAKTGRTTPSHG